MKSRLKDLEVSAEKLTAPAKSDAATDQQWWSVGSARVIDFSLITEK